MKKRPGLAHFIAKYRFSSKKLFRTLTSGPRHGSIDFFVHCFREETFSSTDAKAEAEVDRKVT